MVEEIEMKTIHYLYLKDRRTFQLTHLQLQKLRKHLETDHYPKEETLQALAEELKLQKEVIRSWFFTQRQREMRHRRFLMGYRDWITCCEYSTTRRIARQKNAKECSQNDHGLSEALEAMKRLKLSSGYQSRDGMSQDF